MANSSRDTKLARARDRLGQGDTRSERSDGGGSVGGRSLGGSSKAFTDKTGPTVTSVGGLTALTNYEEAIANDESLL